MEEMIYNSMPALAFISLATGLITEAVKQFLSEFNIRFKSNLIACAVSCVVALGYMAGVVITKGVVIDSAFVLNGVILMVLSWLTAMLGYDKVKQTIGG